MVAKPDFTGAVEEALQRRGRTVVRIQGRSMYPILRHGMCVEVQPTTYDELRIGDLVVFTDGRGIVCHRLLKKSNQLCTLKGDTNLWADPPVVWSQVLGRVTRIVDNDLRIHPIDTPEYHRRAVRCARFSYLFSLYYTALHALGGCRWWSKQDRD
jgi:hypothetical protein